MAIGLGGMLGFSIPRNFNKPYLSRSVSEFWRRWHITLGSWFREYVYFPLGGSRVGTLKTIRNLLVVWLFTGMWHGKGWNFILWGLFIFFLSVMERLWLGEILQKHKIFSRIYMLLYIPMSWVIFAVSSVKDIGIYFSRMFPFLPGEASPYMNPMDVVNALTRYGFFLLVAFILCGRLPSQIYKKNKRQPWMIVLLFALFACSVASMIQNTSNPFLYFRF